MLKLFGLMGLVCSVISGVLIIAAPRTANYLDAAAWILLGLYTIAVYFIAAQQKQQSAAGEGSTKEKA